MIATSGDEAFVMLSLFPNQALILFALLFFAGIFFAWLADLIAMRLHIETCKDCHLNTYHLTQ
jgi:hypothetical protein